MIRHGALVFFLAACSFAESSVAVIDTLYSSPLTLFNGSITAVNQATGKSSTYVVVNGALSIYLAAGSYRVTYLSGGGFCTENWHAPNVVRPTTVFQLRGGTKHCGVTAASDTLFAYRNAQGQMVPIPRIFNAAARHTVEDAGAVPDGILRNDGAMTAGSNVLTSASGSFSSKDVGKYIQVVGAGPGGSTHADGVMTVGQNVLTSATGTFTISDVGRFIVVVGAAAQGANLVAQISNFTSTTQVSLGKLLGTQVISVNAGQTVAGASYYYGYMTLEGTITSYQSPTRVTLSAQADGSISNAVYAYGTNNTASFQAELDALGAAGGGVVNVPAPTSCPTGAICGYVTAAVDMATALNPGSIKIRYNNLSLIGDSSQPNIFCRGAWNVVANYTVRGHCVVIGDDGGPNGTAGETASNVLVSSLHLWGMTNGNTADIQAPASTTNGDGWDWTHKAVFVFHDVPHSNVAITNNIMQDFKGEMIWSGGIGFTNMLVQGNTLKNFNADGISVSVDNLQVIGNTISNGYTGVENGVFNSTLVKQVFQSNQISLMRAAGITLVSEDSAPNHGYVQIIDNTFDTIAEVFSLAPQETVFLALGAGTTQIANVDIERNICHDCYAFILPMAGPNLQVRNNVMNIDLYNGSHFFNFQSPMNGATVEGNHSALTPAAQAHGRSLQYIYILTFSAPANSLNWSNDLFLNNSWQVNGSIYYFFSTTSGAGFAALANKNIIWEGDSCAGCSVTPDLDRGSQVITNAAMIEPYGPKVILFSGTGTPTMTVDASKEQDGSELTLQNSGAVPVNFVADRNLQLVSPVTLAVGQSIKLRYSAIDSKWHLVLP